MKKDLFLTNSKGFSILEVLLASTLMGMILLATVETFLYAQENGVLAGRHNQAVLLAEEGLEAARNMRDEDFENLTDGTHGLSQSGGQWVFSGSQDVNGPFTRQIQINTLEEDRKEVISSITWAQNLQREGRVSLTTQLTHWTKLVYPDQNTQLQINTAAAKLNPLNSAQVIGLTLENIGEYELTIDKIAVSWTNGLGTLFNGLKINGSSVWSGNASSGEVQDIEDFILPVGGAIYSIDGLNFNDSMAGATLTVAFILSDETVQEVTFEVGEAADVTAPNAIGSLILSSATTNSIQLNWTAPGDDGTTGTASSYDVRYSTSPITLTNWNSATQATGEPTPLLAGSNQSMIVSGLNPSTLYYFAIRTSDEVPNLSGLSNVPNLSTLIPPDVTAPNAIINLSLSKATSNSIQLNWTAPGDDGTTGTASSYDVRYSTSPITLGNWNVATQVIGEPAPLPAGSSQLMVVSGLNSSTLYYFAIRTSDEVPNLSGLSNVPSLSTSAPPQAEALVVNTSAVGLSAANRDIVGITLSNSSNEALTIDRMVISWNNARLIDEVRINGTWAWRYNNEGTPDGQQPSGTELDINNINLTGGAGPIYVDRLRFNASMAGAILSITFIMSDGSSMVVSNINPN